jgi:hypothetical protein
LKDSNQVSFLHAICRTFLPAVAVLSAFHAQPSRAESDTQFLLFPYVQASYLSGLADDSDLDNNDNDFGLNLFAAVEVGRFHFLGEALLAKEEQEIERLQLGWRIGDSKAWLGRFHNPIGYWNTQYHHGAFLQTSITRPAIAEFEDDGGVLPMHLAGLLIEGVKEHNESGLGYALAIATGPELSEHLEPLDVLSPGSGSQGLALTFNIYRQPAAYGPNQYGLFANYTEIPAADRGIDEIRQTIAGGYWNWESDPWRLIGSAFYVRNRLDEPNANQTDDFVAAYFQAERVLNDNWSVFGRAEKTFASDNDPYLALFPDHTRERILAGLRFHIGRRHALTLEVSGNREQEDHYRKVILQWAAMF